MSKLPCGRSITGAIASFFLALISVLPLGFIMFWGTLTSITDPLSLDLILLGELAGFVILFTVAFGIAGGYLGENNAKAGAGMGVAGGLVAFGFYLIYQIYTGAATLTFPDWTSPIALMYLGIILLGTLVAAGAIYKTAGYAFE